LDRSSIAAFRILLSLRESIFSIFESVREGVSSPFFEMAYVD
jgi:hypothetical protein